MCLSSVLPKSTLNWASLPVGGVFKKLKEKHPTLTSPFDSNHFKGLALATPIAQISPRIWSLHGSNFANSSKGDRALRGFWTIQKGKHKWQLRFECRIRGSSQRAESAHQNLHFFPSSTFQIFIQSMKVYDRLPLDTSLVPHIPPIKCLSYSNVKLYLITFILPHDVSQ